jgi:hypothetical protein
MKKKQITSTDETYDYQFLNDILGKEYLDKMLSTNWGSELIKNNSSSLIEDSLINDDISYIKSLIEEYSIDLNFNEEYREFSTLEDLMLELFRAAVECNAVNIVKYFFEKVEGKKALVKYDESPTEILQSVVSNKIFKISIKLEKEEGLEKLYIWKKFMSKENFEFLESQSFINAAGTGNVVNMKLLLPSIKETIDAQLSGKVEGCNSDYLFDVLKDASSNNHLNVLELMVDTFGKGILEKIFYTGSQGLRNCVENGHTEIIKFLCENTPPEVHKKMFKDYSSRSKSEIIDYLHHGHFNTAKLLLDKNPKVVKTIITNNKFEIARCLEKEGGLEKLYTWKKFISKETFKFLESKMFISAVVKGDVDGMKLLLPNIKETIDTQFDDKTPKYLCSNKDIYSAMVDASNNNHLNVLEFIVNAFGKEILEYFVFFDDTLAFRHSIVKGRIDIVKFLLENTLPELHEKMIHTYDDDSTIFHCLKGGHLDTVKLLLKTSPRAVEEIITAANFKTLFQTFISNNDLSKVKFIMDQLSDQKVRKDFIDHSVTRFKDGYSDFSTLSQDIVKFLYVLSPTAYDKFMTNEQVFLIKPYKSIDIKSLYSLSITSTKILKNEDFFKKYDFQENNITKLIISFLSGGTYNQIESALNSLRSVKDSKEKSGDMVLKNFFEDFEQGLIGGNSDTDSEDDFC